MRGFCLLCAAAFAAVLAPLAMAADQPPSMSGSSTVDVAGSDLLELHEPTGAVTLRDALEAALLGSPDLSAFSFEVRAREARALQAGLLPNPALGFEVENLGSTRSGDPFSRTETTISLSQLVELGGKRAKRQRLATLERDLAGWDYETRRALVLSAVTRAFVTALSAQERLTLLDELIKVAKESVQTVAAQVRAGAVSPLEQDRAQVALERTRLERVELEHALGAARADLAATWGSKRVTFDTLRGDLARVSEPPKVETFLRHIDDNPDLARWNAELESRHAALAIEKARAVPDVTVGIGGRRLEEDNSETAVLQFSLPLPVFDRNQGGILEAQRRIAKGRAERATVEATVRGELVKAYEALHAAFDQVTTLRDGIIPRARSVFQGARDNYARGLFRYLEVLDAQRTLFEVRSQYLEALARYHGSLAEVERLSGVPVNAALTRRDD